MIAEQSKIDRVSGRCTIGRCMRLHSPSRERERERDQNKMDEAGKQCTAYCAYHCDITEIVCEWSLDSNHHLSYLYFVFWIFMPN